MIDQSDHPDSIEKKFSSQLKAIYNDLSSKYDRYINQMEADDPIILISQIIENYWNIPSKIVLQDLRYEQDRQKRNKIGIPDIPTYRIRFAIEEGSWSVLYRDYFRTVLKDEFNRLITLEEMIWDTDAAQLDDLAYYVLELKQLSDKWINPILSLWYSNHDYGTIEDVAPLLIASYHQSSIDRGNFMLEGGRRLMNVKLQVLERIEKLPEASSWSQRAQDLIEMLLDADIADTNDEEIIRLIITLSILQRELIEKEKSQTGRKEIDNRTQGMKAWENLDPANLEDRENFNEMIIRMLYRRTEEEPVVAADNLIRDYLTELGKSEETINKIQKKYYNKIDRVSETEIIDQIQIQVPKVLIQLRTEELKNQKNNLSSDAIETLPIWDVLMDNLSRSKRIDDSDLARKTIEKIIKSSYRVLIDRGISPKESANHIIMQISENYRLDEAIIQEMTQEIETIISEVSSDNKSLSHLDNMVIQSLTQLIQKNLDKM